MHVTHEGFETFRRGTFGNAGANLFVDAKGVIRRIADQDLNGNGCYDIIMPNSHGYNERGPTTIFTKKDGSYKGRDLPHDSCWKAVVADVDNDGYEDQHLFPYTGIIDWNRFCDGVRDSVYRGDLSFETFNGLNQYPAELALPALRLAASAADYFRSRILE